MTNDEMNSFILHKMETWDYFNNFVLYWLFS